MTNQTKMSSAPNPAVERGTLQPVAFLAKLVRTYTLPSVLIIGAQKAGTTSLASYLSAHPCVVSPQSKEVHFFDLNFERGIEWYRSHFPIGGRRRLGSQLRGQRLQACDATPYYILHPHAPSRIRDYMPTVRIIILLRDPVDRAYSHYHHEVRHKNEKLSFEEAIKAESSRTSGEAQRLESDPSYVSFNYQHFTYVERGIYTTQVQRWLNYFRPSQFLFLSSEEFFEKPAAEFRNVLRFLDLPDWELGSYPAEHVGKYAPMAASTRERLVEFYALHNRTLREQLNSHWPGTGDAIVDRFAGRS